jgi:hypothetical protein
MDRVGYEPTTPVFERWKTVYALDRAVTVIGMVFAWIEENRRTLDRIAGNTA